MTKLSRYFFGSKIIFVCVLFVLASPFYVLMLKPQDHLRYHLKPPSLVLFSSADFAGKIRENLYGEVEGTIDLDSVTIHEKIFGSDTSFVFGLKEYPKNFLLHLRKGDFFRKLESAYLKSKRTKSEEEDRALFDLLSVPQKFKGRIYSSERFVGDPFETYSYKKDLRFDEYRREVLKMDRSPKDKLERWFERNAGRNGSEDQYWLLAVEEIPSFSALFSSTDFPVFLLAFSIGSAAIFLFFWRTRKKGRLQAESPLELSPVGLERAKARERSRTLPGGVMRN